ncbi:MAG TPA: ABC transporter ATP-binding protein [Defluviitaleaceae bacterium]|jgi:ABC-2 type transport system ATP-binding protein|nr:ABC transporter ATP-binding protein [Defluviitaleaceae bacterium]HPT75687.1 ABC transporter ATP-binding protein [Defluviitaleaceae bacterium]
MIEVSNLSKSYGSLKAVDNISFSLKEGEILGFLGPNGAGKTTTMNMICGLMIPDEGEIKINGINLLENPKKAKRHIGYLPEIPPLYPDMTVMELLSFCCQLKDYNGNIQEECQRVISLCGIDNVKTRLIKNLSKGYRQRTGIATALIGNPKVLILDEPTVGLDPKQIKEIRDVIKSLSKKHSIILSSHILPEVNALCDRIVIINKGKIAAIDTPDNLSYSLQSSFNLYLEIEGPKEDVLYTISSLNNILSVEAVKQIDEKIFGYVVKGEKDKDIRRSLFYALADGKMPMLKLEVEKMSLEDAFLHITLEEDLREGEE